MTGRGGGPLIRLRVAAGLGAAAPAAAGLVSIVAGLLTPGYNPARASVSVLGGRGQPYAVAVNGAFVLLGAALIALAWALHQWLEGRAPGGTILLAAGGAGIVVIAFVSRDPAAPTITAIHRALAAAALLAMAAAPLLTAVALRQERRWQDLVVLSSAAAVVSAIQLPVGAVLLGLGMFPAGAVERTFAGINLLWVTLVAIRLLRGPARARGRAAGSG
jgi:hypothetical protein